MKEQRFNRLLRPGSSCMTLATENPAVMQQDPKSRTPDNPRCFVLGVGVSAINIPLGIETVDRWIREQRPNYVCVTGVHGVMESQTDPKLKAIHNAAGMVTPDGMPM